MKIMLVSDLSHYSTKDVFDGYVKAFESIAKDDSEFDFVVDSNSDDIYALSNYATPKFMWSYIIAKALIPENKFTHVLFVAGGQIPEFVFKTLNAHGVDVGIISTEDPHGSKHLWNQKDCFDYYFTNELRFYQEFKDDIRNPIMAYVPTSVDSIDFSRMKYYDEKYKRDIVFVGCVYPNRVRGLEMVAEWVRANDKVLTIVSPDQDFIDGHKYIPEDSIIRDYMVNAYINNSEARKLYASSGVVINIDRDVFFDPVIRNETRNLVDVGVPYSMNPRGYEIAACGGLQLFINPRQEAIDIFKASVITAKEDLQDISNKLDIIFSLTMEQRRKLIEESQEMLACGGHTYKDRALKIIKTMKEGE